MTTYQFRAPHCYPTRGDQRREHNHAWSVVGGWRANNNSETLQGWRDDPLPHSLSRVVADTHLSTRDHLDVETLSAHHHERAKRLAVFAKAGAHAFSQREAARPAAIPAEAPDHLAYTTEGEVLNSVLNGHAHPAQRSKGRLDAPWSAGAARDGRGVAGGWSSNQHPDVKMRVGSRNEQVAADTQAQVCARPPALACLPGARNTPSAMLPTQRRLARLGAHASPARARVPLNAHARVGETEAAGYARTGVDRHQLADRTREAGGSATIPIVHESAQQMPAVGALRPHAR